jgi:hypothetical protein
MTMTDDLARIAEVLEDNASRATNAVQRQIMTSNAAVVRDAKARIEALTADNARLRSLVQEADDLIGYALPSLQWKRECREFRVKARLALNTGKEPDNEVS